VYILEDHKRLIGSFSIKTVDDSFPVQIEESVYMYRLLVHPFYQGKDMTHHMFKHLRKEFKKKPVLLDCWAGNEKLSSFYKDNDCLFLGDFPEKDYKISVFQVGKRGNIVKDKKGYFKKV
jgi:GNAT superfamily N-acetyltransferase